MTGQNMGALVIIALFMFIPLMMGAIAGRKSLPTTEDFFVQGRSMGSIAVFFTVAATWWSASAFLGSNAFFYLYGPLYWTAIAWNILFGVLYYGVGKKIWFFGKRNGYITPKDFFKHQYGSEKLGNIIAIIMLLFTLPYLQVQLSGGAYLIEIASGGIIRFEIAALMFYAVIIIYVWSGGLRAVAWTDIFYGLLLFCGMIYAGIHIVNLVGGPTEMFQQVRLIKPENLILGNDLLLIFGWVSMFLVNPIGAFMGPQMWTRVYAVKSPKLFNLMPFLLGLAAIAYIGSMFVGNTALILEPNTPAADKILPIMLYKYAPYVLASLIIACGAAAAMSTANSQIHSMSAVYTMDIHKTYINKNMTERQLIWVGRWAILVFSAIAYVMCLYVPGLLLNVGLIGVGGTAQVIVPVLGALYWRRSTVAGAISSILVSITLLIVLTLVPGPMAMGTWGMASAVALAVNVIIFVVVSLITKPRPEGLLEELKNQYSDFKNKKY